LFWKYETGGPNDVFRFRVALCTGVAAAEIHQQVLSHVAKPSRCEVGSGVDRRVETFQRVLVFYRASDDYRRLLFDMWDFFKMLSYKWFQFTLFVFFVIFYFFSHKETKLPSQPQ
jgi:hypothetical protein